MNREEKQKLVLDLSKQGKTIREIAQTAHMSFGDISFIIRRETGEAEEQERIRMSKSSQALKMFEEGNTPVQVAIKLDMETREVDRLYREYWNLTGLHGLNDVYVELKGNIFSLVKLYHHTKKEGMTQQQVIDALKIAEKIPNLEAELRHIEDCIDTDGPKVLELKRQKESLDSELKFLREHVEFTRENSDNKLKSMQEEIASARVQTNFELNKQKESLAMEMDKYKASLAIESKSLQLFIDKLKREEEELTRRIQWLNNEELEILRLMEGQRQRKQQQEQSIQESQSQLKQQSVIIALAHELHTQATKILP